MKDEAAELERELKSTFGEEVEFKFVDVSTAEIKQYPQIASILSRVRLPLTVINGQPRFHGGLSAEIIGRAVGEILEGNP